MTTDPKSNADKFDTRDVKTTQMLEWALRGPNEKAEKLIDWLDQQTSVEVLEKALQLPAMDPTIRELLVTGQTPIEVMRTMKEGYKAMCSDAADADQRAAGTVGYLLVQAAAAVHHGVWISQTDRNELRETLTDMATALPAPWSGLCRDAARAATRARYGGHKVD